MEILYCIMLFILGAIFGSFLGCMGYRIPNKIKTTYPSSYCEHCKKTLKWYMNIPILSYIFLRGKCAYCKEKIDSIYFFTELLCSLLFVINYLKFGFTVNFYISTILTCMLIVTMISDFLYYYVSDRVVIFGTLSLIIVKYIFVRNEVFQSIIVSASIFGIMCLIKLLGNYAFKKESLGDGDIKLMAVIALAVGLYYSFVTLFIACLMGILFSISWTRKNKDGIIPFGPFLLMSALITLYFSVYVDKFINLII